MTTKKRPNSSKKGVKKEDNSSKTEFRLLSKTFFLTYKGLTENGGKITKENLANYLLNQNLNERSNKPEKYLICEEMYDSGEPHFHVILVYPKRKDITSQDFYDYLGIHPNIQTMRNMKAALQYVHKEDSTPYTNMDITQEKRVARAKDSSSLYEFLREQMMKDPFNFDVFTYCVKHNLDKEVYKANYSKAIHLLKKVQQAQCNQLLSTKPGFKPITRTLIQQKLTLEELKTYDSWSGYQTIVDYLNQVPTHRFRRPAKTMNLLITGPKSTGKSALIWQTYIQPPFNPLNAHISVYPMGMKDWFPEYKSEVYDCIYWNQTKLTSYAYDTILQLLDGSPVMLPAKGGGHKKIDNPIVLMTSNMTLQQMIKEKFKYNLSYQVMARDNLSVRIQNVIIPDGLNLFLLQKLLVSNAS